MKMDSNIVLSRVRSCWLWCGVLMRCRGWSGVCREAGLCCSRSVINIYHSASGDSDVVSQALYGSGVVSLEKKDDWIHIRTGDDYTGWVAAADVRRSRRLCSSWQGGSRRAA